MYRAYVASWFCDERASGNFSSVKGTNNVDPEPV